MGDPSYPVVRLKDEAVRIIQDCWHRLWPELETKAQIAAEAVIRDREVIDLYRFWRLETVDESSRNPAEPRVFETINAQLNEQLLAIKWIQCNIHLTREDWKRQTGPLESIILWTRTSIVLRHCWMINALIAQLHGAWKQLAETVTSGSARVSNTSELFEEESMLYRYFQERFGYYSDTQIRIEPAMTNM